MLDEIGLYEVGDGKLDEHGNLTKETVYAGIFNAEGYIPNVYSYINTYVRVDLSCIPFTEAVSTYSVIAEIVTDDGKLLLYGSFRDGGNQLICFIPLRRQ